MRFRVGFLSLMPTLSACPHTYAGACVCLSRGMYVQETSFFFLNCDIVKGVYSKGRTRCRAALTVSQNVEGCIYARSGGEYICLNQRRVWNTMVTYGELHSEVFNGCLERYSTIFAKEVAYAKQFICRKSTKRQITK